MLEHSDGLLWKDIPNFVKGRYINSEENVATLQLMHAAGNSGQQLLSGLEKNWNKKPRKERLAFILEMEVATRELLKQTQDTILLIERLQIPRGTEISEAAAEEACPEPPPANPEAAVP